MKSSDKINELFERVSNVEDRDAAAFEFRDYLLSQNVAYKTANKVSTAFHQLLLDNTAKEIISIIREDKQLTELFETWALEKDRT
jgi:hypothetical protein